jgi:1-pyrroline-5-carboxylate dehydrogenase
MTQKFKLTYATMFNPPDELHTRFENALASLKSKLGSEYGMIIAGKDHFSAEKFENRSPIDTEMVLGVFQKGSAEDAGMALSAARKAFPGWSSTPWQERVALMRKAADMIDERIFEIGAAMALEVGKNRMESLGDVAETADLIRYSCYQMEKNGGYIVEMGRDPLVGYTSTNTSVLRPYGVWLVISPFNFPAALTGGPSGAALVAGNTIVMKPATDTPWVVRLLAECFRDAGLPEGVFNYVTGPGRTLGQALIDSPEVDGVTFTGSFDVGMGIFRDFAQGRYVRPAILELGGKNPAIVSRNADLERASAGIIRSAFGLQGQKCSACSRVFIEEPVYDELVSRLVDLTAKISVGDPTDKMVWMGPVINKYSYEDYQKFVTELAQAGRILTGGELLSDDDFAKGYFCAPTLAADVPLDHYLWKYEMFLPITTIAKVSSLAGVNYANRPQGATTGAWPGFQPFGGWKGSGSSGKNAGGHYYLPLYMHEQIRTVID